MFVTLKIGQHIVDLLNPTPEMIDLDAIEDALWSVRRWSGNPKALTIRQHTMLVRNLAKRWGEPPQVIEWCWHHDDHEGIIGDIPGPLKHWINAQMEPHQNLNDLEDGLDYAICMARGINIPLTNVRRSVHFYDKLAETLEWRFVLDEPQALWNRPFDSFFDDGTARKLIDDALNAER